MTTYVVDVIEMWGARYHVEAKSEAEAKKKIVTWYDLGGEIPDVVGQTQPEDTEVEDIEQYEEENHIVQQPSDTLLRIRITNIDYL